MKRVIRILMSAFLGVIVSALSCAAFAADYHWQGAGTGGNMATDPSDNTTWWGNPDNWLEAGMPGATDSAYFMMMNPGYVHAGATSLYDLYLDGISPDAQLRIDSGVGRFDASSSFIGHDSIGHAVQTGGEHRTLWGLVLGQGTGSSGRYELVDGLQYNTRSLFVARSGRGEFIQRGGRVQSEHYIYVGAEPDGNGTYRLVNGEVVVNKELFIGYKSHGALEQENGTIDVETYMAVGGEPGGVGTYDLAGGALSVGANFSVGWRADGALAQTGGRIDVDQKLYVAVATGVHGTYTLRDGNITILDEIFVGYTGVGTISQSGGLLNTGNHLSIGLDTGRGSFTQTGGTVNVEQNLYLNQAITGTDAYVQTGGRTDVDRNLYVGMYGGRIVSYRLGGSGHLKTYQSTISQTGTGLFYHDNGLHETGYLLLSNRSDLTGTYNLAGGHLEAGAESIGFYGTGIVNQSGGRNRVTGEMQLGFYSGSHGTMNLSGGSLISYNLRVGHYLGVGTLNITSDQAYLEVRNELTFGPHATFTAVPGATIHMTGAHFQNQANGESALAGMDSLTLIFEGGPTTEDLFEIASLDMGQVEEGYALNFGLDALSVGSDNDTGWLRLVDDFNNSNRGGAGGLAEALYVNRLILTDNSLLDLNGYHLYCRSFEGDTGSVINGQLDVVPEPTTLVLMATGLLGVLGFRRRRRLALVLFIAFALVLAGVPAARPALAESRYRVVALELLAGGVGGSAMDVNNQGTVAGWSYKTGEWGWQPVIWKDGSVIELGRTPYTREGRAWAINDSEQVTGWCENPGMYAFLWENGAIQALSNTSWAVGQGIDINNAGTIVANTNLQDPYREMVVRWCDGAASEIATPWLDARGRVSAINDSGQVVGYSRYGDLQKRGWVTGADNTSAGLPSLPGGTYSVPHDINDRGVIVGEAETGPSNWRPCLWENGTPTNLGILGTMDGFATGINERNQIVGVCFVAPSTSHAVLWEPDGSIIDLNDRIGADSGWTLSRAHAINDRGQIVGRGLLDGTTRAFLLNPLRLLSINASYLNTSFTPVDGDYDNGLLAIDDAADVVVEYDDGQTTFQGGHVTLTSSLFSDLSEDGRAVGLFRGGALMVKDDNDTGLLTANVLNLRLDEVYDNADLLAGKGLFEVTGGSLAIDFGQTHGDVVQITFQISPGDLEGFSTAFDGVSDITLTPIPEPGTMTLVGLGIVGLAGARRRRGRRRSCHSPSSH